FGGCVLGQSSLNGSEWPCRKLRDGPFLPKLLGKIALAALPVLHQLGCHFDDFLEMLALGWQEGGREGRGLNAVNRIGQRPGGGVVFVPFLFGSVVPLLL